MKALIGIASRLLLLALVLSPATGRADSGTSDGDPLPGNGTAPIEWEAEQPEIIIDDGAGVDININDLSQFDPSVDNSEISPRLPEKRRVDPFLTLTCDLIRENRDRLQKQTIQRTTQYFTPMFEPGESGRLQSKDRRACINVEGSCIVEKFLYNWSSNKEPWGKLYVRRDVKFKFGRGSGQSYYNTTNALDPCRSVAADKNHYAPGTVVYIPTMRGKLCPQNGKPIDGCFVVSDVGSAIKGSGRFDIFAGECALYNKNSNTCADPLMKGFEVPKGTPFYVVGRHNMWAKALREEADMHINNNWIGGLFP